MSYVVDLCYSVFCDGSIVSYVVVVELHSVLCGGYMVCCVVDPYSVLWWIYMVCCVVDLYSVLSDGSI